MEFTAVHRVASGSGTVSLHIFCPTIGRTSILALLASVANELTAHDFVTVAFDGQDRDNVFTDVQAALSRMPARTMVYNKTFPESDAMVNGAERAHRMRNSRTSKAHNTIQGDFWLFADDDNLFRPNFARNVKDVVAGDLGSPYFFRGYIVELDELIWREPEVYLSNIDTGCGVIPSSLLSSSTRGNGFAGDFTYYNGLVNKVNRYYMIDWVIFDYTKYSRGQ